MKAHGLARLFDTLTAEERFRLVVQALAREDRAEADRLVRTCPKHSYAMADAAYTKRWEFGYVVVLAVAVDLAQHLAKLEGAAAFAWVGPQVQQWADGLAVAAYRVGVEQGAAGAWSAAGHTGDPPRPDATSLREAEDGVTEAARRTLGTLPAAADPITRDLAVEARTVWEAFSRFCRGELGLEPETVLGAYCSPLLGRLEAQREVLDRAEPNSEQLDEYAALMASIWRRRLGSS